VNLVRIGRVVGECKQITDRARRDIAIDLAFNEARAEGLLDLRLGNAQASREENTLKEDRVLFHIRSRFVCYKPIQHEGPLAADRVQDLQEAYRFCHRLYCRQNGIQEQGPATPQAISYFLLNLATAWARERT
jgi:hypothetical protein